MGKKHMQRRDGGLEVEPPRMSSLGRIWVPIQISGLSKVLLELLLGELSTTGYGILIMNYLKYYLKLC
jgi:hypothetical protein